MNNYDGIVDAILAAYPDTLAGVRGIIVNGHNVTIGVTSL